MRLLFENEHEKIFVDDNGNFLTQTKGQSAYNEIQPPLLLSELFQSADGDEKSAYSVAFCDDRGHVLCVRRKKIADDAYTYHRFVPSSKSWRENRTNTYEKYFRSADTLDLFDKHFDDCSTRLNTLLDMTPDEAAIYLENDSDFYNTTQIRLLLEFMKQLSEKAYDNNDIVKNNLAGKFTEKYRILQVALANNLKKLLELETQRKNLIAGKGWAAEKNVEPECIADPNKILTENQTWEIHLVIKHSLETLKSECVFQSEYVAELLNILTKSKWKEGKLYTDILSLDVIKKIPVNSEKLTGKQPGYFVPGGRNLVQLADVHNYILEYVYQELQKYSTVEILQLPYLTKDDVGKQLASASYLANGDTKDWDDDNQEHLRSILSGLKKCIDETDQLSAEDINKHQQHDIFVLGEYADVYPVKYFIESIGHPVLDENNNAKQILERVKEALNERLKVLEKTAPKESAAKPAATPSHTRHKATPNNPARKKASSPQKPKAQPAKPKPEPTKKVPAPVLQTTPKKAKRRASDPNPVSQTQNKKPSELKRSPSLPLTPKAQHQQPADYQYSDADILKIFKGNKLYDENKIAQQGEHLLCAHPAIAQTNFTTDFLLQHLYHHVMLMEQQGKQAHYRLALPVNTGGHWVVLTFDFQNLNNEKVKALREHFAQQPDASINTRLKDGTTPQLLAELFKDIKINLIDSVGEAESRQKRHEYFAPIIAAVFGNKAQFDVKKPFQQSDDVSCGPIMVEHAMSFLRSGKTVTLNNERDIPAYIHKIRQDHAKWLKLEKPAKLEKSSINFLAPSDGEHAPMDKIRQTWSNLKAIKKTDFIPLNNGQKGFKAEVGEGANKSVVSVHQDHISISKVNPESAEAAFHIYIAAAFAPENPPQLPPAPGTVLKKGDKPIEVKIEGETEAVKQTLRNMAKKYGVQEYVEKKAQAQPQEEPARPAPAMI